jgi:hypothetical protein
MRRASGSDALTRTDPAISCEPIRGLSLRPLRSFTRRILMKPTRWCGTWRAEHLYQVQFGTKETADHARAQLQSWIAKVAAK